MAVWVPFTPDEVLKAMPAFIVTRYQAWIVSIPAKQGRLAEIVAEVRTIFREAVRANPANVLDPAADTVPAAGLHYAVDMAAYTLIVEMGALQ